MAKNPQKDLEVSTPGKWEVRAQGPLVLDKSYGTLTDITEFWSQAITLFYGLMSRTPSVLYLLPYTVCFL